MNSLLLFLILTYAVQVFLPTVTLRQQAFIAVQEHSAATQELHIPATWQVGASNAISLIVGAGVLMVLAVSWQGFYAQQAKLTGGRGRSYTFSHFMSLLVCGLDLQVLQIFHRLHSVFQSGKTKESCMTAALETQHLSLPST